MSDYSEPSHKEIEVCAFYIWEQEGRPEGRALDHWLQAQIQLVASRWHEEVVAGQTKAK